MSEIIKNTDKKDVLVTLADKNYVLFAKQVFSSAYWNAGWKGDYLLLSHEIPEEELKWFTEKGILVKRCIPLSDKTVGREKYPPVVLNTFYLFTSEFKKWKNIVFLDGDIIVRASLDRLTKVKGLASPHAMGDLLKYYFYDNTDPEVYSLLNKNFNLNVPAFNCGIMSFSTKIIKDDIFDSLIQILKTYKTVSSGSDPTFNQFFYNTWKRLPLVYDITPKRIEMLSGIPKDKVKGIIIHLRDDELLDKNSKQYKEWESSLNKADAIDLRNIPEGKKWSILEIKLYSFYLNSHYHKARLYHWLKIFFKYHAKPFFTIKVKNFFLHKVYYFLVYIFNTPERIIGKTGEWLKKHFPELYNKLKKQ